MVLNKGAISNTYCNTVKPGNFVIDRKVRQGTYTANLQLACRAYLYRYEFFEENKVILQLIFASFVL